MKAILFPILAALVLTFSSDCFAQGKVTKQKKTSTTSTQKSTKSKSSKQVKSVTDKAIENQATENNIEKDITIIAPKADGVVDGMEYVDLGLSVKWANFNLGAESPEGFGDYYAWAETTPKEKYWSNNYKGAYLNDLKHNRDFDAASTRLSKLWRIPSEEELSELIKKCVWEWGKLNEIYGYKVTGPNGKYIFIPAAGYKENSTLKYKNTDGYYRNSTNENLRFYDKYKELSGKYGDRYLGYSIRPVLRNEKMPKVAGELNGHEYVDLGLSVKWALYNIGQTELDGEDSHRFNWGSTTKRMPDKEYNKIKKQIKKNTDISGNYQFDAATQIWGNGWRMPTVSECSELLKKCNWDEFSYMGKHGYKVTGPNGNFIFIVEGDYFWTSGQFDLNKDRACVLRRDGYDGYQIQTEPIDFVNCIRPVTNK